MWSSSTDRSVAVGRRKTDITSLEIGLQSERSKLLNAESLAWSVLSGSLAGALVLGPTGGDATSIVGPA
jgi:hypothetical protein